MPWPKGTDKEKIKEYNKAYRRQNQDRINQQDKDYYNRRNDKLVESNLEPKQQLVKIVGPFPVKGEKAVYYLRTEDGLPFYAGSTSRPNRRMIEHRKNYGKHIEMVILKCCRIEETVYWESKLIVDLTELGYSLNNLSAPIYKGT